jgi:hypothetical protein
MAGDVAVLKQLVRALGCSKRRILACWSISISRYGRCRDLRSLPGRQIGAKAFPHMRQAGMRYLYDVVELFVVGRSITASRLLPTASSAS